MSLHMSVGCTYFRLPQRLLNGPLLGRQLGGQVYLDARSLGLIATLFCALHMRLLTDS